MSDEAYRCMVVSCNTEECETDIQQGAAVQELFTGLPRADNYCRQVGGTGR